MAACLKSIFLSVPVFLMIGIRANTSQGEITGRITDTETNQAIEYATITLYEQTDSSLITGTISNAEGVFVIRDVQAGNYFLKFTCLGFQEKTVPEIAVSTDQKVMDIGDIRLEALPENIGEVVVNAEKRAIEYHIDKDVINVDRTAGNTGGMAADVLNNHPAIETRSDGSVMFRGNSNFIVLIDGKPTSDESTDILNQIPASSINKIEIITNPSAKYDANHAAGIVNIITKKSEIKGFSGILNGSVSNAERYNSDVSLSYRVKKVNISTHTGFYHSPIFQDRTSVEERIVEGQNGFQNFHSDNILLWEGKNINMGIDYYASDKNTVSLYINRSSSIFGWSPQKTISEGSTSDTGYYRLDDYMRNYRDAWHFNFSDVHKFNDNKHEIRFDANVIIVDMSRVNNQYLYNSNNVWEIDDISEEYHLNRFQDILRQQYRADYSLPFSDNTKLESGILIKSDNRTIANDIVTQIVSDNDDILNDDTYESYNNLFAAYATFMQKILKSDLQVGLRVEYANRNTTLTNGIFSKTYKRLDFFPSLNLIRQFADNHRIKLGYSRSVWRPTDLQLNPTIYFRDISGEFSGNAILEPSYTHSVDLNYNLLFKNNSLSVTGFYKYMKSNITTVRYLTEDSIYHNSPENLQGNQQDMGIEFTGTIKPLPWLTLNPGGNFYNGYIKGSVTHQDIKRRTNVWAARIIAGIEPLARTHIQINAYYNSPTMGAQFYMEEIYGLSFSIKQDLFHDKLSISISGDDILQTEKRRFVVEGDNFKQQITDVFLKHPVYSLSLTLKLNNFNRKQRENVEQGIGFF